MITYRFVRMEDAARLAEIQFPYTDHDTSNLATTIPTEETFRHKIEEHVPKYPFIVAEEDDKILGYSYASEIRPQEGYNWCVEMSIYLDENCCKRGIGSGLYRRVLPILDLQGYMSEYSVVTYPNPASQALHAKFGFREIGRMPKAGYKLDKWWDVMWLVRLRDQLPEAPAVPLRVDELDEKVLEKILRDGADV